MNKLEMFIAIVMILLIILFIYLAPKLGITGNLVNKQTTNSETKSASVSEQVLITKDNFQAYLEKQSIIQDLPKNAELSLVFSDTNEAYILTKSSVKKGLADNPDITITIPSKYIPSLGNLCNAIKTANTNRDLSYEINPDISKASLLWKYKGMTKYKDCLG
ncbi:MAG: hypothetical protein WCX73_04455 [Candidatus Pacearchaeota archaeon]|jgi:hypothetical protein